MRILIDRDPFLFENLEKPWQESGLWPCSWIACPASPQPPFVSAFRRYFSIEAPVTVRIHVAADERYDLYLDGEWIGRGNERGAPDYWFFDSYEIGLSAGDHSLVARVWSLGDLAAQAQMSVHPCFLLAAEGHWMELLGTGLSDWQAVILPGYEFTNPYPAHWRGARVEIDGSLFQWGYERGGGPGWQPAVTLKRGIGRLSNREYHQEHILRPAILPALIQQPITGLRARFTARLEKIETNQVPVKMKGHLPEWAAKWNDLFNNLGVVELPANSLWRVIIDLNNYYTAYPGLVTTGGEGSRISMRWAESLFLTPNHAEKEKGNRNELEGKYFIGFGDSFRMDGGSRRMYEPLWWQAGRYVELVIEAGSQPLVIEQCKFTETRYPLEMESEFNSNSPVLEQLEPLLIRGMQMCSNETFFDCPYYEELMYAGDTRLECLVTYVMARDDRLPRKALRMFDASRLANGLTQSRYPSRIMQIIAPFALWWVMMVRDYALWKDDVEFIKQLLPGVRATLEGFERFIGSDGLLYGPEGWNTIDWVPEWDQVDAGVPPDGHVGASGVLNWQLIYALAQGADLEQKIGEPLLAEHMRRRAARLAEKSIAAFWDARRGLLADDVAHQHFSEHTQCFALLSDFLQPGLLKTRQRLEIANGLLCEPDLSRTTIYFNHYLFETYRELGRVDKLFERLQLWSMLAENGLKTPIEQPEPSRSDCHGWGSHPLFHYFATILGIRPAEAGFRSVEIRPQMGHLEEASGRLVHPGGGEIVVDLHQDGDQLHGTISLPDGLTGRFFWRDRVVNLQEGKQEV